MHRETVTLNNFYLINATEKAILICDEGNDRECWIPRSQIVDIEYGRDLPDSERGISVKEIIWIEIPEWLAAQNDLN